MLKAEFRRVPASLAIMLVAASAALTGIVMAALDHVLSDGGGTTVAATSPKRPAAVIELGQRYPKPHRRVAAPAPPGSPASPPRSRTPLSRLVGAKVIVRMQGTYPSSSLLSEVRRGTVGGVILFPENVASRSQLRSLTGALQRASAQGGGPGVVVAVDQEGGPVKRLSGPPSKSPNQLAALGSAPAARSQGVATGTYLSSLGINVDFAPVLDVPGPGSFMASRAFGRTPGAVGRLGGAFAAGLSSGGVTPTLKHFPGLGRATANTDLRTSVVQAPAGALRADMQAFEPAIQAGAGMVMMSTATYRAFGSLPAALNPTLVGQLRNSLGFGGVVVTDDLEGGAVKAVMPPPQAGVAAARAGVDMVLFAQYPASGDAGYRALLAAARAGRISRGQLQASYSRIRGVLAGAHG
jgi:beta-N-acetylhexosaminidase